MLSSAIARQILSFVGPGILSVFAFGFILVWYFDRKRTYVWLFSLAIALYSLGAASQIFRTPADAGLNAVFSALLYASGAVALVEGLHRRSGRSLGLARAGFLIALVVMPIGYFFYGERNLLVRVYVLNFGLGAILLYGILTLGELARGRVIDRLAFWAVTIFALHFFPRTMLSLGGWVPTADGFGRSVFWVSLQIVLPVLAVALALILLALPLVDRMEELGRDSTTDPLTGLLNRRGFEGRAARLMAGRHAWPLGLIVCDLDRFKAINDTYGHPVGDAVLRKLGRVLAGAARDRDVVARIGGEEFVVLLANCSAAGAVEFAERLRRTIAAADFPLPEGAARVTASFGVTAHRAGEPLARLVHRADELLYRAKAEGRNRARAG